MGVWIMIIDVIIDCSGFSISYIISTFPQEGGDVAPRPRRRLAAAAEEARGDGAAGESSRSLPPQERRPPLHP